MTDEEAIVWLDRRTRIRKNKIYVYYLCGENRPPFSMVGKYYFDRCYRRKWGTVTIVWCRSDGKKYKNRCTVIAPKPQTRREKKFWKSRWDPKLLSAPIPQGIVDIFSPLKKRST